MPYSYSQLCDQMTGGRNLTNGELLDLLDDLEAYLKLQTQLSEKLSRGRFGIVTARKYQVVPMELNRVEEASLRVECQGSPSAFHQVVSDSGTGDEPLLLLCPLPPPALKKTKQIFTEVIDDVLELASIVLRLQRSIQDTCTVDEAATELESLDLGAGQIENSTEN